MNLNIDQFVNPMDKQNVSLATDLLATFHSAIKKARTELFII